MLPCGTNALITGFRIGTFIQNDQAAGLQSRLVAKIALNLLKDRLGTPRRLRHEMLEGLTIAPVHPTIDIGKVALILHGQLPPPKRTRTFAGIARACAETWTIALPESIEIISELLHGIAGYAPAIGIEQIGRE
jgi:hypothetical protein